MARIVGNDGNFSIDTHSFQTTAWTLNVNRVVSDVTAYGDSARSKRGGIPEYTGSASGYMEDDTSDPAITATNLAATSGEVTAVLTAATGNTFTGEVVISGVSVASNKTGDATISFDFAFNGDVTVAWT